MNDPAPSTAPTAPPALDDWRTVNALADEINRQSGSPVISAHALRHYIHDAPRNGLQPHVRRLGRKILISKSGFAEWLYNRPATRPSVNGGPR